MKNRNPSKKPRPGRRPERKKPKTLTRIDVDSLAWGGKGVGRADGKVIFVSKAVPGDSLLVKLTRIKSRYAEGAVEAVLKPSSHRVEPRCKFFSHCGGCQWLSTSYDEQLKQKELLVTQVLRHHLEGAERLPALPADPATAYRHRGTFHVKPSGGGVRIGFYQEESRKVVNLDVCLLFDDSYNERYGELRKALKSAPQAFSVTEMTLARSEGAEQYALHLQLARGGAGEAEALCEAALKAGVDGVLVTPAGAPERILARSGRPWTTYGLPAGLGGFRRDLEMRADVRSFTQAHYAMNRRLVELSVSWLGLAHHERLLELYAGLGNFTLPLSRACKEVVAVEASPFAHEDAKENARLAEVENIRHVPGDAADWTSKMVMKSDRYDALLLDPPRTGARDVVQNIRFLSPRRILYISCNLPALDRDLGILGQQGYRLARIQPVDLFPQTYNLETVCLLERE
ncbi:MAG: class I SAM-dependent RNA methyltransferase [Acidobacteriota bacterium]|jgi:23S rRNA (uracil1939-C5)-methyltransferase